jgi:ATP-dependent DNA helicase RecQ
LNYDIHKILKENWGYDTFRPLQEDIISSVLSGNDTLALLPTGGGKSICFQVPGIALPKLCLVVSPLIALMKDQVLNLKKKKLPSDAIFSGMTSREIEDVFQKAIFKKIKFLYLSPERLETRMFGQIAHQLPVSLIAIDEAHCISQWGYDFRPSYLNIARIRAFFPDTPFIALTATATPQVKEDIVQKLELKNPRIFQKSFDRPNLLYIIRKNEAKENKILEMIRKQKGSGIIYVYSRRATKKMTELLCIHGISASAYHAGLSHADRNRIQEEWIENKIRVIVATNAFGMGIDKPDVRFVYHLQLPDSLEAYFQEAGRAGRDLRESYAITLINENDKTELRQRLESRFPSLKVILHVYSALCNYLKIPLYSGKNQMFEVPVFDFCRDQKLNIITVFNSLNELNKSGLISFQEQGLLSSRLMFISSYNALMEFQEEHPQFKELISTILRSYGGVFDIPVSIEEKLLARRNETEDTQAVIQQLQELKKMEIIDYQEKSENPVMELLVERLPMDRITLPYSDYKFRMDIAFEKVEAVLRFVFEENTCRNRILLSYFGEKSNKDCGHCDYCLKKRTKKNHDPELICKNIIQCISEKDLNIEQLSEILDQYDRESICTCVRDLIKENEILLKDNQILTLRNVKNRMYGNQ